MKSAFHNQVRSELTSRLCALRLDSPRAWGKMSVHQAICHLSDAFRLALGEKAAQPFGSKALRPILRVMAFHLPMKWPRGVKTMPELE